MNQDHLPLSRQGAKISSLKFEARNPKQIQIFKMDKIQNKLPADRSFGVSGFRNGFGPVCFGFRYSDF